METKHTLRPWKINEPIRYNGFININDVDGGFIAQVIYNHDAEANARLIVAAPDLLEACEQIVSRLYETAPYTVPGYILKAIKKAKGIDLAKPVWSTALTQPQYKACSVLAAECLHKYGVLRMQASGEATRMLHNANVAIGALALCCAEMGVSTEYLTLIQSGHINGLEIISDKGRLYEQDYDFKG